jgi:ABC-type phosphate transport system substrate-binding protein
MRPVSALAPVLVVLAVAAMCATVFAQPRPLVSYVVIVNPSNQTTALDRAFLEDAFLKKVTRWSSEDVIRPADLVSGSPVRRQFTEDILRRSVEAVKGYWQQRIFSGRDVPPPEFEADGDVIRYVLKYQGALAYVSTTANLNGAKVVAVR